MKSKPKDIITQLKERSPKAAKAKAMFEGNEVLMVKVLDEGLEVKIIGSEKSLLIMLFSLFEDCPGLRPGVEDMLKFMKKHNI